MQLDLHARSEAQASFWLSSTGLLIIPTCGIYRNGAAMSETRRKLLSDKVRRYYACVDMNDIDGVLDLFSLDATYERPGYPTIVGRECLERFYSEERTIRNGQHTVVDLIAVDNRAAVHGYFAGTLKSGKSVELRFADFFIAADDGAFTRRDTFFFAPMV